MGLFDFFLGPPKADVTATERAKLKLLFSDFEIDSMSEIEKSKQLRWIAEGKYETMGVSRMGTRIPPVEGEVNVTTIKPPDFSYDEAFGDALKERAGELAESASNLASGGAKVFGKTLLGFLKAFKKPLIILGVAVGGFLVVKAVIVKKATE